MALLSPARLWRVICRAARVSLVRRSGPRPGPRCMVHARSSRAPLRLSAARPPEPRIPAATVATALVLRGLEWHRTRPATFRAMRGTRAYPADAMTGIARRRFLLAVAGTAAAGLADGTG